MSLTDSCSWSCHITKKSPLFIKKYDPVVVLSTRIEKKAEERNMGKFEWVNLFVLWHRVVHRTCSATEMQGRERGKEDIISYPHPSSVTDLIMLSGQYIVITCIHLS